MLKKRHELHDSSPWDAPCPKQGRSSEADPRFTVHGSGERCENDASETARLVSTGIGRVRKTAFFGILLDGR